MSVSFSGLTPNNLPTNQRAVLDANYIVSTSLPSSASTVHGGSLYLGDATYNPATGNTTYNTAYATTETINFQIVAPALSSSPKIADNGTVTYTIEDSADNSSFTAIAGLATLVQTGAGGNGAAASTLTVKLPPGTRAYVRVSATTATSPGDLSTANYTAQVLF